VGIRTGEGGISGELGGGVPDSSDGVDTGTGAEAGRIGSEDGDRTGRAIFCPRSNVGVFLPGAGV